MTKYHILTLLGLLFVITGCKQQSDLMVIAHRGGVVDKNHSENSLKALEEAIHRGYTHVEIDARVTADGKVVCFHNDNLLEEAGIDARISNLSYDSVKNIVLLRSREKIPGFDEYLSHCAGRIGVMVDLKGCPDQFIDQYAVQIESSLKKYNLLNNAFILINKQPVNNQDRIANRLIHKAKISWRKPLSETRIAFQADPDFAKKYYIFNHGEDFDAITIRELQSMGLQVIVSINIAHYSPAEALELGSSHLDQMLEYGVDGVQIDAIYDHLIW